MPPKKELLDKLRRVEELATASKWKRLLHNPFRYFFAIAYKKLSSVSKPASINAQVDSFFNKKITIKLPASTDIYLTGGKTHDSEIRLARYLIHQLSEQDIFLDVGAHYGYFSLLASELTGKNGQVIAFEAAPESYAVLEYNAAGTENLSAIHQAVAEKQGTMVFYQFPNQYSEYNSFDRQQFEAEDWFQKNQPEEVQVATTDLDSFCTQKNIQPDLIKIDVEGAEFQVLSGAKRLIADYRPVIAMEYLTTARGNVSHQKAASLLLSLGYESYRILQDGNLERCPDINDYLAASLLESDNIVFKPGAEMLP